ncbi:hypothetical protein GGR57DRAFT_505419 [Xylariaceae sp. FL1272]|nr:hypothetical protein GGR57DRAFT_505419 [Xylariaceae sp. FL1272]
MASQAQELTHEEIWDDSVLKYHSIHRNGGNVNDLVKPEQEVTSDAQEDVDEASEPMKLETTPETPDERPNDIPSAGTAPTATTTQHASPPPAPVGLLSTIKDEGLKRLLMSWYYAGYYTGYYEGQRDGPPQNAESSG